MVTPDFLARVIGDPRVWYVIYNRVIWSRRQDWKPERYTGDNPHVEHVHVSLINNQETRRDGSSRIWDANEVSFAERSTTGCGLASLITKSLFVRVVARIKRRGY